MNRAGSLRPPPRSTKPRPLLNTTAVGPPSTWTFSTVLRPVPEYSVLDSRASFPVHHSPVAVAASPHGFTSCGSTCAARPGTSETSRRTTNASSRGVERAATTSAPAHATTRAASATLRSRIARRRGRRAHDERRRELHAQRLDALAFEQRHQQADAGAAELLQRLSHGRELRPHDARLERVVEADDRHVLGRAQTEPTRRVERADRDVVVEAEDR